MIYFTTGSNVLQAIYMECEADRTHTKEGNLLPCSIAINHLQHILKHYKNAKNLKFCCKFKERPAFFPHQYILQCQYKVCLDKFYLQ